MDSLPQKFRQQALTEITLPPLLDQQVRVRKLFLSVDPYMRGRWDDLECAGLAEGDRTKDLKTGWGFLCGRLGRVYRKGAKVVDGRKAGTMNGGKTWVMNRNAETGSSPRGTLREIRAHLDKVARESLLKLEPQIKVHPPS